MKVYSNEHPAKLLIFDLDGTLYPREAYVDPLLDVIARMFVELRGFSHEAALAELEVLRQAMRENWDGTSLTAFIRSHGFTIEQWRDYRSRHLTMDKVQPDPGLVDALAGMRRQVQIALLTNNTRATAIKVLTKVGLAEQAFDVFVTVEDVGQTPKPNSEAFVAVLTVAQIKAENAWAIGDRYSIDIEPLRRLGGAGILVSGPDEVAPAGDYVVAQMAKAR